MGALLHGCIMLYHLVPRAKRQVAVGASRELRAIEERTRELLQLQDRRSRRSPLS